MTLVVAGEALIDLVPAEDGTFAAHPGGGPYNVACALGRLGRPVAFLGRLSTDAFGRILRDELQAAGVDLSLTQPTEAPTTLALAEPDGYRFYVEGTSAPGLEATDLEPEALCVGALGLVLEPMASVLETLTERAGFLAVDPNIRPSIHTDAHRDRLRRILRRADVVKVSDEDLAWLAPRADPVEAARGLASLVFVTRGRHGALVVTPEDAVDVPAPEVRAAHTIGAGDRFMGALLACDLTDPVAAARFACEVAARSLATPREPRRPPPAADP